MFFLYGVLTIVQNTPFMGPCRECTVDTHTLIAHDTGYSALKSGAGTRTEIFSFSFAITFATNPQCAFSLKNKDVLDSWPTTANYRIERSLSTSNIIYTVTAKIDSQLYTLIPTYFVFVRPEMQADQVKVDTTAWQASPYQFNYVLNLETARSNNNYEFLSFVNDFYGQSNSRDPGIGALNIVSKSTSSVTLFFKGKAQTAFLPQVKIFEISISYLLVETSQFDSNIEQPQYIQQVLDSISNMTQYRTLPFTRDFVQTAGIVGMSYVQHYINSASLLNEFNLNFETTLSGKTLSVGSFGSSSYLIHCIVDSFMVPRWLCPSNQIYFPTDHTCHPTCPPRTFLYLPHHYCKPCHYSCYTCYTSFNPQPLCSSCISSDFRTFVDNTCSCDAGYFDNYGSVCVACHQSCMTCMDLGSSKCLSCADGWFLMEGSCVVCDYTCMSCSGVASNCQSCPQGRNIIDSNTCPCNPGTFDKGVQFCPACDSNCAECITTSRTCTNCHPGYFLQTQTCNICHYSCTTCLSTSIACLSCASHRSLVLRSCPCLSGYFDSGITTGCTTCHQNCATCNEAGNRNCATCKMGLYSAGKVGNCEVCHYTCRECQGMETRCVSCAYERRLQKNACLCEEGSFDIGEPGCLKCGNNTYYKTGKCHCQKYFTPVSLTQCQLENDTYTVNEKATLLQQAETLKNVSTGIGKAIQILIPMGLAWLVSDFVIKTALLTVHMMYVGDISLQIHTIFSFIQYLDNDQLLVKLLLTVKQKVSDYGPVNQKFNSEQYISQNAAVSGLPFLLEASLLVIQLVIRYLVYSIFKICCWNSLKQNLPSILKAKIKSQVLDLAQISRVEILIVSLYQLILFSRSQYWYYPLGLAFLGIFILATFFHIIKNTKKIRKRFKLIFQITLEMRFLIIPASFILSSNPYIQVGIPIAINTTCCIFLIIILYLQQYMPVTRYLYYFIELIVMIFLEIRLLLEASRVLDIIVVSSLSVLLGMYGVKFLYDIWVGIKGVARSLRKKSLKEAGSKIDKRKSLFLKKVDKKR